MSPSSFNGRKNNGSFWKRNFKKGILFVYVVDHDNNQIQEMGIDFSQLILRWGIDPGCWQFCSEGKNWIPCVLMYRFLQGCSMLILLGKETTAVQIRLTDGRWEAGRRQRAKQGNLFLLMCNNFPMSTGNHCQDVHCCFTEKDFNARDLFCLGYGYEYICIQWNP